MRSLSYQIPFELSRDPGQLEITICDLKSISSYTWQVRLGPVPSLSPDPLLFLHMADELEKRTWPIPSTFGTILKDQRCFGTNKTPTDSTPIPAEQEGKIGTPFAHLHAITRYRVWHRFHPEEVLQESGYGTQISHALI